VENIPVAFAIISFLDPVIAQVQHSAHLGFLFFGIIVVHWKRYKTYEPRWQGERDQRVPPLNKAVRELFDFEQYTDQLGNDLSAQLSKPWEKYQLRKEIEEQYRPNLVALQKPETRPRQSWKRPGQRLTI
jgi:hypothetical protein